MLQNLSSAAVVIGALRLKKNTNLKVIDHWLDKAKEHIKPVMDADVRRSFTQSHAKNSSALCQLLVHTVMVPYRLLHLIYEVFL